MLDFWGRDRVSIKENVYVCSPTNEVSALDQRRLPSTLRDRRSKSALTRCLLCPTRTPEGPHRARGRRRQETPNHETADPTADGEETHPKEGVASTCLTKVVSVWKALHRPTLCAAACCLPPGPGCEYGWAEVRYLLCWKDLVDPAWV